MSKPHPFRSLFTRFQRLMRNWAFLALATVTLTAPVSEGGPAAQEMAQPSSPACLTYHTIRSGETLAGLAADFQVAEDELAAANRIEKPYFLEPGEKLCIPGERRGIAAKTPPESIQFYTYLITDKKAYYYGKGFPIFHAYFVQMRIGDRGPFVKVGTVYPRIDGSLKGTVRLHDVPKPMPHIWICLKEVYRGYRVCRVANNN